MGQQKYTINEYGEIIREDYFFSSVKGNAPQPLPTNRKVWKMVLLGIITLGIYNIIITFAAAKETNIACAEDGKHTRGFWGAIGLSIITLGIYAYVWWWKWINREYNYLERNSPDGGMLTGGGYFFMIIVLVALQFAIRLLTIYIPQNVDPETYLFVLGILFLLYVIVCICMLAKWIRQHNTVNKIYNLKTFGRKL